MRALSLAFILLLSIALPVSAASVAPDQDTLIDLALVAPAPTTQPVDWPAWAAPQTPVAMAAAQPVPVPLPATLPMALGGIGLLLVLRLRRHPR